MPSSGRWSHFIDTPVGVLEAVFDPKGRLKSLSFAPDLSRPAAPEPEPPIVTRAFGFLGHQLDAYFQGQLRTFNVPLDPDGSAFQQRVWGMLLQVPYGRTTTYADLARHLGDLKLTRAVGGANGHNPIPIIIPCHRVIGSDGTLVGYAGGLERKEFLLRLEGVLPRQVIQPGLFEDA
jgi:methylated-DNA-[protein]-cysteine S-methyltransferase